MKKVSGKGIIWKALLLILLTVTVHLFFKQASHDKDWVEEQSILPSVEIDGSDITIKNVRDWRYDTNGVTSKGYVNRRYNLNDLIGASIVVEQFSEIKGIAHTLFVFDFKNAEPIALSIEARMEQGESYSVFQGMFKKFESIYVWATEQDVLGRRAIWSDHELYMFPVDMSDEFMVKFFDDLLATTQDIYDKPQFYNSLLNNCTNAFAHSANRIKPGTIPLHIARILPGYSDRLLYKLGYIKSEDNLDETRDKAYITDSVKDFYNETNFSELIRQ